MINATAVARCTFINLICFNGTFFPKGPGGRQQTYNV